MDDTEEALQIELNQFVNKENIAGWAKAELAAIVERMLKSRNNINIYK